MKVFIEFATILLLFYALGFRHQSRGILAPQPEIECTAPALEGDVLATRPLGKFLVVFNINTRIYYNSEGKASACNAGDLGSIPASGRSPGEGNGNPLQYSCLENPIDREAYSPWDRKKSDTTERLHFHT